MLGHIGIRLSDFLCTGRNIIFTELSGDLPGAADHRIRNPGQLCHLDSVALICAAPDNLP